MTKSGINTSNITIRDEQAQQALTGKTAEQIKSEILTSVTTDTARENSGVLKNNFDKDKVQSEINLQMDVTKRFGENAPKAVADFAESKADSLRKQGQENEARKWDEGGIYRVAAHSALGALMGGDITSTLAAGATAKAAPTLNTIQDHVKSSLEASGLSKNVAEGLSSFVTTAAAFGIGNTIGGNASTGAISANIDMNNRQLHVDEIARLKKEAAILATQNGQMSRDGYEYWFTLVYSVAYGKVDTEGREQLMIMAKQWDKAGKDTNDFSLQQLSKNIKFASNIVDSMAGKVLTDNSNKPIMENGAAVKTFQATEAQKKNTSLFGYDSNTAGLKAKDDPKSYGSSGTANKTAQGTVRRENEDLVDGLERGSKGVVPVFPEIEVIGLGAGKLGKEITEKAIKAVENQVAKQVVKDAEKEAVKKQTIENNVHSDDDLLNKPFGRGDERAAQFAQNWDKGDLKTSIDKLAGKNPKMERTDTGKVIYTNKENGVQVIYDLKGNYFRVFDPSINGKRKYLDLNGSVPNNKILPNGKQAGRTQSEYNEATHFKIK